MGISEAADKSTAPEYGYALATAGIIIGGLMILHPTADGSSLERFNKGMSEMASRLAAVHGLVVIAEWIAVVGLLGLCDQLGFQRLPVRFGIVAFVVGIAVISLNAIINGFVAPGMFGGHDVTAARSSGDTVPLLELWKLTTAALSTVCVIACSFAVLFWSFSMLSGRNHLYWLAIVGAICAAVPLIMLGMRASMDGQVFGVFVAAQCAWYVIVGVALARK